LFRRPLSSVSEQGTANSEQKLPFGGKESVANVIELMTMPLTARLALPAILMASGCRRQKAATPETRPNKTGTAVAAVASETSTAKAEVHGVLKHLPKCSCCNLRFVLFSPFLR